MTGRAQQRFSLEAVSCLVSAVSFPWTVCVLFYGDHAPLCRRFLEQLYRFTDPAAFRLRAGMNAVCPATRNLLKAAQKRYRNVSLFPSRVNLFKCPMMRRLFHHPPPDTEWTIWFDDDSFVTNPGWVLDLAMAMERWPSADLFGSIRGVDVSERLEEFITSARWYRGIPRQIRQDSLKPVILFPMGGFWAIRTARLMETDWPDHRLEHFEDDYLMGEAMRQQGVKMVNFDSGVSISDAPRRAPTDAPQTLKLDH
jgi:hypothetical protein